MMKSLAFNSLLKKHLPRALLASDAIPLLTVPSTCLTFTQMFLKAQPPNVLSDLNEGINRSLLGVQSRKYTLE